MQRLLRDAGWILGFRLINLPLQLALFTLAARYLSLAEVGGYAVFYAAWTLARSFGPLGLDQASSRFVPAFLGEGRTAAVRRFERLTRLWAFAWVTAGAAVAAGVGIIGIRWGLIHLFPEHLIIAAVAAPAYGLIPLYAAQLRAIGRPRAAQFPDSVLLPGGAIVFLSGQYVVSGASLSDLLLAQAISAWLTVAVYAVLDRSAAPTKQAGSDVIDWAVVRGMATAVFIGVGANALSIRLPVILITAAEGLEAAALFEAGQRFAFLATLSTWSVGAAVTPMLSSAFAAGDRAELQRLLAVASWASFLPALAALGILVAAGNVLLLLFGPAYVAAYPTMVLLALFTTFNASAGLSGNALNMTGHERTVMVLNFLQLAVVAAGVPLLSAMLGTEGAALALVLSSLVRDGGASLLLRRRLGIAPGIWSVEGTRIAWRTGLSGFRRLWRRGFAE
jgi:O-antigen/teichoic acid export membrane protein